MASALAANPTKQTAPPTQPGRIPARPRDLLARVLEPTNIVTIGLLAGAFVLLFHGWLWAQHLNSWDNPDWSHAYLVPLISLYLIWQKRGAVERAPTAVFWPGMVAVLTGVAAYVYFIAGVPNHLGQGLAMLLTLFGLVLLMLGPAMMPHVISPIGYLLFAITMPEQVMIKATFPLQILAAKGAYIMLKMVHSTTDLQGNVLLVTDSSGVTHPLNVATACSGMRTVIAFIALAAAVGLVATGMWWKRVVLMALSVPTALLINAARIALLGLLTLISPSLASGNAHTFIGTLWLIPGFGLYMLVVYALNKGAPEGPALKGGV